MANESEINEAVAKKLGNEVRYGRIYLEEIPDDMMAESHPIPDYCHSIAAVWEIVEHLTNKIGISSLALYTPGDAVPHKYFAFKIVCDYKWYEEIADIAPMAICLAFLKLP